MINWVIIVAILIAVVVFFKMGNARQSVTNFLTVGLLLFFLLTFGYVTTVTDADFTSFDGIVEGLRFYFSWLANLGRNAWSITGNAINMDWGTNITNFTK